MRRLLFGLAILMAAQAGAHGEDKPGPHGGLISMPGAFHVEVVPVNRRKVKIYLLDINWKNPTLRDSSVEVTQADIKAICLGARDHFICEFPRSVDLAKRGDLSVQAYREKLKGNVVKYGLPL